VVAQIGGAFNRAQSSEGADFDGAIGFRPDSAQLGKMKQIHYIFGFEELLPHGGDKVGSAGKQA
jgi:hypothetical protein